MDIKKFAVIGGAAVAAAALPVWFLAPGRATGEQKAPFIGKNCAHRGLHTQDFSTPENSLKGFDAAASAGYGIELDVQLSKDGQVVVFHDDDLKRVCGIDSMVNEKTYLELNKTSLRGTKETVPLFIDVLSTINGRGGPLIVELKSAGKKNRELCEKTYEILKNYKGTFCVESFDPRIVFWFRLHAGEIIRGQLAMKKEYYKGSKFFGWSMSVNLYNFLTRPHFIAYDLDSKFPLSCSISCALGAIHVGWTSHDVKNEKRCDTVIFEFYRPNTEY